MIGRVNLRPFTPADAGESDALLRVAFQDAVGAPPAMEATLAAGTLRLSQSGSNLIIAHIGQTIVGIVRWWEEEGIAWGDLLASRSPGAGRGLVHAVERAAQDGGWRLLRANIPDRFPLPDYFARLGYFPVARAPQGLVVEKRLPLLTVREQRRQDADAIEAITGEDAWPFAQGRRPGWFVLADGERIAGVVAARQGRDGTAEVIHLVLEGAYKDRGLEAWMLDRVATWAETAGCHTVLAARSPELDALSLRLEASRWFLDGARYRRTLAPDATPGPGSEA